MSRRSMLVSGALIALVIILGAALVVQFSPLSGKSAASNPPGGLVAEAANASYSGISVSGTGVVQVKPNVAQIQLGVETTDLDVTKAQQDNSTAMNSVIDKLKSMGIKEEDIQTTTYDVSPIINYDANGNGIPSGFHVTNIVVVKVRSIDQTGPVIDAAITAGANRTYGITFTVDDTAALEAQARDKAMQNAKDKAQQLAKAAGVTLGQASYISDGGVIAPVPVYDSAPKAVSQAGGGGAPVQSGQLEVRVDLQVIYSVQ
jgi:uncharacterized protein